LVSCRIGLLLLELAGRGDTKVERRIVILKGGNLQQDMAQVCAHAALPNVASLIQAGL
jgi:hypothetical protein